MSPLTARRNATGGALEGSFTTIVRGVSVMSALLDDGVPVSPKARSGFSPLGPLAKAPRLRVGLVLVAVHSRLVLIAQEQVRLIFRALRDMIDTYQSILKEYPSLFHRLSRRAGRPRSSLTETRSGQAHHPDASLGMGLCQPPSEAIIASAASGPQLRPL
jgi:hypothetical protein